MDRAVGAILALQIAVVGLYFLRREIRNTGEWVSPFSLLLSFAILDVYLAAFRLLLVGGLTLPPWMLPLSTRDLVDGMIWFTVGTTFLLFGIKIGTTRMYQTRTLHAFPLRGIGIHVGRGYALLAIFLFIYLGSLLQRVREFGSLSRFIEARSLSRYSPTTLNTDAVSASGLVSTYINGASLTLTLMLVGILFYSRYQYRKRILWGFVLPAVAWVCTLVTFFRGYQLSFFLGLLALETARLRIHATDTPHLSVRHRHHLRRRHLLLMAAFATVFFVGYGTIRTVLNEGSGTSRARATSPSAALASQLGDLTSGASLIGMSEMAKYFADPDDQLGGETIAGSLLLPVPRLFWHSKPSASGFLALSSHIGWAASTQSAVSWPGEFYANFGALGLPLLFIVGLLIGYLSRLRTRGPLLFVYVFVLLPAIMVSHWMSILGLMNQLIYAPLLYVAARMVTTVTPTPPAASKSKASYAGEVPLSAPSR